MADVGATHQFLTDVLGFSNYEGDSTVFETGADGMHHVAWHVRNQQELTTWQKHLHSNGCQTSGEVDRHYFKSLYFHIPSGILFEIATDGPGFATDGEDSEHLGKKLALPPFL